MKVFVCKACSCHLELLLQERCMFDYFCSSLHCFHYLFQVLESLVPNGNFAERWRWIEDWRLKIEGLGKACSIHMPTKLKFWIEEVLFQAFNVQSSIRDKGPKNLRTSDLLKSFAGILDYF